MRLPDPVRTTLPLFPLASFACGGPAEPRADSTYVLEEVDGRPMPATFEFESGGSVTLLGDTLRIGAGDTFERVMAYRVRDDTGSDDTYVSTSQGTLVPRGSVLVLRVPCNDTVSGQVAVCLPPDTARASGDNLVVRSFFPTLSQKLFVLR